MHGQHEFSLLVLSVGAIVVLNLLLRSGLRKIGLPALVGYLAVGMALRLVNDSVPFLGEQGFTVFRFLGKVGVIALLVGISMVPRAEIAMIIMQRGRQLGDWAVPPGLYAAVALVAVTTCVTVPWLLGMLLPRWRPADAD